MKTLIFFFAFIVTMSFSAHAQYDFPFQNPDLTTENRVDDLVYRLTIEEKIDQLMHQAPAIDRLGIPKYNWWNESLHGVARAGYATVFPQSITIAASWDEDLMHEVASVISDEARAKHNEFLRRGERGIYQGLTFWSPNINIFRDPRWGRGHETYGEDPYLTGQMGKEFVLGLQGDDSDYLKVVATAKHFAVHSGPESLRHTFDAKVSERDLRETYLPAFRTLVKDADVYSVMGAYNRFRGEASCASSELFNILRDEWGFDGYVVSDCGAIADIWKTHKIEPDAASAAVSAVQSGCDLNCGDTYEALTEGVKRGLISEKDIDLAVKRLFTARFKLGMFDPVDKVKYAQIPFNVNNSPAHSNLSRQAARKSIVLLKNENNMLPLSKDLKTIAVIGPNANDVQSLWGNYNGIPSDPVTVLKGIQNKLEPKAKVLYAQGSDLADGIPEMEPVPSIYLETLQGEQGLKGEYFDNKDLKGDPLFTQVDDNIDFVWDIDSPDPRLKNSDWSIRWTGFIVAPKNGTYYISDWGKPYMTIQMGKDKSGGDHQHHGVLRPFKIDLVAGEKYPITVEYKNYYGDATAKMMWAIPKDDLLEKAVETANNSDVVILALGLNERLEGEEMPVQLDGFSGGDRTNLKLPKMQVDLMKAVVATGKPIILVLINGSALAINWAEENISAIITAGYPGQQGGNAIADVLFGDYNPAGRLPVTYYKSVEQLPAFEDYDMAGRTYRYFHGTPLFPFGYGLSYTTFNYGNLQLPKEVKMNDQPMKVSVDVTNTGEMDGDEVVQLYLTDEKASTPRPIRQLEGFKRIHLKKGETKTVSFLMSPRQLSMINKNDLRVVEPGWFNISVGGKQPGFTGNADASTTSIVSGRFRVTGKTMLVED